MIGWIRSAKVRSKFEQIFERAFQIIPHTCVGLIYGVIGSCVCVCGLCYYSISMNELNCS